MTVEEIIESILSDTRPAGPDGCSNYDRVYFLQQAFGMEEIDLSLDYDFTTVIEEPDPVMICGAKHIAMLKLDFTNKLLEHCHITHQDWEATAPALILAIRRIDHHLSFAEQGLPTPPHSVFE